MRNTLLAATFGILLIGCEAPGPSEAEIAQCMRFNQSKYDDYAASEATERARQKARLNNAMSRTDSALTNLTGGYSMAYRENENVSATCRDYVLGCASPLKFQSECAADITFIWYPD